MSVALAIKYLDVSRRRIKREYNITLSGSYVTGGDTVDLTTATNPIKTETAFWGRIPTGFNVENSTPNYKFEVIPGTTLHNWKLKIYDLTAAGVELAAGAYPGALTADTNIRISFDGKIGV